jgi:hypothetical protein
MTLARASINQSLSTKGDLLRSPFFGNKNLMQAFKQKFMELREIIVEDFNNFISGNEVEVTAELKDNKLLHPGDHILAVKNSLAAETTLPVPREKQDQAIGIEARVTAVELRDPVKSGKKIMRLRVQKV